MIQLIHISKTSMERQARWMDAVNETLQYAIDVEMKWRYDHQDTLDIFAIIQHDGSLSFDPYTGEMRR